MTLDQVKRIQLNNYCSEHDKHGKQFDYEAKGYKEAIDARYWELVTRSVDTAFKQAKSIPDNHARRVVATHTEKQALTRPEIAINQLNSDIEAMDIQLAVLKAFNPWRYISNEIMMVLV